MTLRQAVLPFSLWLFTGAATAAVEIGSVTLADSAARVLRGATWYRVVPGVTVEDADIITTPAKTQLQIELAGGTIASLGGEGTLLLNAGAIPMFTLQAGWLKAAVKAPGARVKTPMLDVTIAEGIAVIRADAASTEVFTEAGSVRLVDNAGVAHEGKRGEHWSKSASAFASRPLAPRAFVDAMPRTFVDPLPVLAGRLKSKPALVVDHEITYAEAEPWLAGRDRAVYERRFAVRLRDPEFRKAVEPFVGRYPSWDRRLHPEKYAPKAVPPK